LKQTNNSPSSMLIAGFLLCFSISVFGEGQSRIEIRTIGIPPYGIGSGENASGLYYDIANLLVQEAGFESNNLIYPYARIVSELKTGETDLTIMFKYPNLDDHVVYIAPLAPLKTVVLGLKGVQLHSLESLRGKTLAYLRGAQFSIEIDNDTSIKKQITDDFVQGARMLVFGRVDALIGPIEPLLQAVKSITDVDVLGEPLVVSERTPWIQVSKMNVHQLSPTQLRGIFQNLKSNGDLDRIRHTYLPLEN